MADPAPEPQPGDGLLAGDYVELSRTGLRGTFVGFDDEGGSRFAMVIREDGVHGSGPNGTYTAYPGDVTVVRRLSPPTPSAPPCDRLFETGCVLCGSSGAAGGLAILSEKRINAGALLCPTGTHCFDKWRDRDGADAEITRRKSLATPAETKLPIGEFRYGITTEESRHGAGVLVQGWVKGLINPRVTDVVVLEFRDANNSTATVRRDSLSRERPDDRRDYADPPEPARVDPKLCACGQTAWRNETDYDDTPICGDCSSMVAALCLTPGYDGKRGEELRKAHRKLVQTRNDLDRTTAQRKEAMRGGWDSDEADEIYVSF